jgi:hypothetical protein
MKKTVFRFTGTGTVPLGSPGDLWEPPRLLPEPKKLEGPTKQLTMKAMSNTKPNIYGAIACHLSSLEELALLCRCLQSVLMQTKRLDIFCVSWSAADTDLKSKTRAAFPIFQQEFVSSRINFKVLYQENRCQQFQHYFYIHQFIANSPDFQDNALIIFGDADDVWDNNRVRVMYEFACQSSKPIVVLNWHVEKNTLLNRTDENCTFEYWSAVVRFRMFTKFFNGLCALYLQSPYCDLAFATFLQKEDNERAKCNDEHLYYYAGSHHSAGASTNQHEVTLKTLEIHLMECYPEPLSCDSDFCSGLKPTGIVIKPITMSILNSLKNGSAAIEQYVKCH